MTPGSNISPTPLAACAATTSSCEGSARVLEDTLVLRDVAEILAGWLIGAIEVRFQLFRAMTIPFSTYQDRPTPGWWSLVRIKLLAWNAPCMYVRMCGRSCC